MGWLIEFVVDVVWNEWAYRTYKKHGWFWALMTVIGPLALAISVVALALALLR